MKERRKQAQLSNLFELFVLIYVITCELIAGRVNQDTKYL